VGFEAELLGFLRHLGDSIANIGPAVAGPTSRRWGNNGTGYGAGKASNGWRGGLNRRHFDFSSLHFIGHFRPALLTHKGAFSAPASAAAAEVRPACGCGVPNGGKYMIFRDLRKSPERRKTPKIRVVGEEFPLYGWEIHRYS